MPKGYGEDRYDFGHLLPFNWQKVVEAWLDEDIPSFDIGGFVVGDKEETAILYGKSDGVFAGRPFFDRIFTVLKCQVLSQCVPEVRVDDVDTQQQ